MREIVKVRTVAGSTVVTLPGSVLDPVGIEPGDRVVVEAAPPRRLVITKLGEVMTSAQRLELELDLLEKRKKAIESDMEFKVEQWNRSMTADGIDDDIMAVVMGELRRDRDRLEVEIAEKKLALYDLQGGVGDGERDGGESDG